MNLCRGKSTRIVLLPIFFSVALTLLLTACGGPGSTPTTQGASTSTATLPSSTSVPSPVPTNATLSTQIDPLQAIRMVNTSNGWALTTKNTVLKTSDGGHHWQDVTPKAPAPGKNPEGEFLTAQAAWLAWEAGPDQPITL